MISFKAIVTADFHFTTQKNVSNAIVPMMSWCDEVLLCIVQQVKDIHPDAFIILGDNTNSGNAIDRRRLARRLLPLRREHIPIVMVPGNHDFNHCDIKGYRDVYEELMPPSEYDAASLSHGVTLDNIRLLAMDDSSFANSTQGKFHPDTIIWLRRQLSLANTQGQLPLFLSHHNVLLDTWTPHPEHYQIQNKNLARLLKKQGASIVLSAHQHFPSIRQDDGIFEIIVPMPFMSPQVLGCLTINDDTLSYETIPIALSPSLQETAKQNNAMAFTNRLVVFQGIFKQNHCPPDTLSSLMKLIEQFYVFYEQGLGEREKGIIRNDPLYPSLMHFLGNSMYKGWIDYLLNHSLDSEKLILTHNGQAPWRFHHDPHRL